MMLNMDFVLRLLVAGILGAIIGLDREYRAFYQVTMVIKSKRNNDEGHLLSLIQEFPDVTVQRIE